VAVGVYPGTFNPPTVAHLAIATAAADQCDLERIDLVLSRQPLGKDHTGLVRLQDRLAVLEAIAADRPWLGVLVTDQQLIADIADGYDAVVLGADKWSAVIDVAWYGGSVGRRDREVARLPRLICAPRPPHPLPSPLPPSGHVLDLDPDHHLVSATHVRGGRHEWMTPEARAFDARTGAWSDADRYAAFVAGVVGVAASPPRPPLGKSSG
jgi:hypothetical protein